MKLVSIFKAAGQLEAEMIKTFLEAQEIPVSLNQESVGRTFGLSAGRLGEVHILVPDSQSEEAKQILKELFEGKYELSDELDENPLDEDGSGTA